MFHRPLTQKLAALRDDQIVEYKDLKLKANGKNLEKDGLYYAARNTEGLFTAKEVDLKNGWVVPNEPGYSFDLRECIPVDIVE